MRQTLFMSPSLWTVLKNESCISASVADSHDDVEASSQRMIPSDAKEGRS